MGRERIWFEHSRWRWLRWPALCASSVVAGLLLVELVNWWIKPPPEAELIRLFTTRHAEALAAAPAASNALTGVALVVPEPAAQASSTPAEASACREPFSMKRPSSLTQSRHGAAVKVAGERVRTALQGRGDENLRAIAWYLDDARDDLARLAAGSSDASLYTLAVRSCQGRTDGNCQLITAQVWAERDGLNVVPWLWLANAADQRGDAAAVDEALRHAAQATTAREGRDEVLRAVISADAPRDWMGRYQQLHLVADVMGKEAARSASLAPWVRLRVCGTSASRSHDGEALRQAACLRVADVLASQGDSLMLRRAGLSLGEASGWTAARVAQVKSELDAMGAVFEPPQLELDVPGCDAVRKALPAILHMASRGEIDHAAQVLRERGAADTAGLSAAQIAATAASVAAR